MNAGATPYVSVQEGERGIVSRIVSHLATAAVDPNPWELLVLLAALPDAMARLHRTAVTSLVSFQHVLALFCRL